jgi:hypothetical protein
MFRNHAASILGLEEWVALVHLFQGFEICGRDPMQDRHARTEVLRAAWAQSPSIGPPFPYILPRWAYSAALKTEQQVYANR